MYKLYIDGKEYRHINRETAVKVANMHHKVLFNVQQVNYQDDKKSAFNQDIRLYVWKL